MCCIAYSSERAQRHRLFVECRFRSIGQYSSVEYILKIVNIFDIQRLAFDFVAI